MSETLWILFTCERILSRKRKRTEAIYSIPCNDFDHEYIGLTNCQFGARLEEHQKAIFFCKEENSALSEHTCPTNRTIGWDKSKLITTTWRYHQRLCLEDKGPLVAATRSPLMKALDRSFKKLGLWIVTSRLHSFNLWTRVASNSSRGINLVVMRTFTCPYIVTGH